MNVEFSIIVCTYNRPNDMRRLLTSIEKSSFLSYELLILDQSNNILTEEIVKAFANKKFIFHRLTKKGLSLARNIGIKKAKGENIVFVDDDCIVTKDWLDTYSIILEKYPDVGGFFGRTVPYQKKAHVDSICPATNDQKTFIVVNEPYINYHLKLGQGNNFCLRKNVVQTIGKFNESLGMGTISMSAEDTDYIYRILKKGIRLGTCPEAVVFHNKWLNRKQDNTLHYGYTCGIISFSTYHFLKQDFNMINIIYSKIVERFVSRMIIFTKQQVKQGYKTKKISFNTLFEEMVSYCIEAAYLFKGFFIGLQMRLIEIL